MKFCWLAAFMLAFVVLSTVCGGRSEAPAEIRALSELERGLKLQELGNLQKALQAYDAAVKLDPKLAEGYARRGDVYIQYSNMNSALSDVNQALNLD
ncbi:MAG: tetratricopeptide repeat protein, partial [Chloroflexi bacterium]|nr:tetratricopeptide repeat protein [Chloroflexota bacterium]